MYDTVADKLNYIPHRDKDTSFDVWMGCYAHHIKKIYDIFIHSLCVVEPFNTIDFTDQDRFTKFAKMLYKKSSGII